MALSELPPAIDEGGEAGSEPPLVRTPPPGAMSKAWLQRLQGVDAPWTDARRKKRAELTGLDHAPIVLASGKGSNLFDLDGNRYVDLVAAFGACLLGHGSTRVARTMEMQSERLVFGLGDVFPTDAKIGLSERLCRLFPEPGARVMLGLSGADAIDAAIKTALLHTTKPGILAFRGGYHGLATGPLSACGLRPEFRLPFAPHLSPHVRFADFPGAGASIDAAVSSIESELKKGDVGCVLVEPVQGRGGVVVPPGGFLAELRRVCDTHRVLLVADEIWTGLGRSGSMLRSIEEKCVPDLVCLGKGLGGGLPISACIGRASVMESWRTPRKDESRDDDQQTWSGEAIHTSTHAGSPLACASAIAVLDSIIGTKLVQRSKDEGAWLLATLKEACADEETKVREVRGAGLMIGVEVEGGAARGLGLARDLLMRGYLVLTGGAGDVLTLTPPLNVSRALLEGFVETFVELARMRAV